MWVTMEFLLRLESIFFVLHDIVIFTEKNAVQKYGSYQSLKNVRKFSEIHK